MVQRIRKNKIPAPFSEALYGRTSKSGIKKEGRLIWMGLLAFVSISCQHFTLEKKHSRMKAPPLFQKKASKAAPKIKAKLEKGLQLYKAKKFESAKKSLQEAAASPSAAQAKARLFLALSLFHLKDYDPALGETEKMVQSLGVTPELMLKSLRLQWKILGAKAKTSIKKKLFVLNQIIEYSPSNAEKQKAKSKALSLIEELSASEISSLTKDSDFLSLREVLLFFEAKLLVENKKFKKALNLFKQVIHYGDEGEEIYDLARQYISALTARTRVKPHVVGALLPLSGPYKKIGKRCLDGLALGLGIYDDPPSPFQLAVRDSEGKPSEINSLVKNLLLNEEVIGIIGGAASSAAVQLAHEAQNFMIPSILLSQKSGLTNGRPYIFQNAAISRPIVKTLVDALIKSEHENFAILYPNDPFGIEYANLFWDSVLLGGKHITAVDAYKPGESDFNDHIERLTGTYYKEDRDEEFRELAKAYILSKKKPPTANQIKNLLPPVVDFSVLFIPDSIRSLKLIAPYLSFNDIKGVTLAGPSLWNSKTLLKQNKKHIEGLTFADALITGHKDFKTSSFFASFTKTFGYEPSLFERLSFEAALAFRTVIDRGARSRESLREHLSKMKTLPTPLEPIQISKRGEFIHKTAVFQVRDGQIMPFED